MPAKGESAYTEAEITECLMALIAWAGNATAAVKSLKSQGKHAPASGTLTDWSRRLYAEKFEDLRERYSDQLEKQLIGEYREVARLAVDVQREALEVTMKNLKAGKVENPSRTAADAATVADKMTRDMLSLSGRPTSIREDRNLEQIMRSLAAKGIVRFDADEPAALPAGEAK